MNRNRVFFVVWTFSLSLSLCLAEEFTARCTEVADGDTVTLLRDGFQEVKVRLEGVDCPERSEPYGEAARRFVSALILDKQVTVRFKEVDKHGRQVSRISVDGLDVSIALVLAGLARHYREYSDDPALAMAEQAAREAKLGVWSGRDPAPGVPILYHGNRESKVLHGPGCQYYNCSNCTVVLDSLEAAVRAGFRPHAQCIPGNR